jgi:hypothetical protein
MIRVPLNDNRVDWLIKRVEQLEERITWIERLLMREGRELFSDTANTYHELDGQRCLKIMRAESRRLIFSRP